MVSQGVERPELNFDIFTDFYSYDVELQELIHNGNTTIWHINDMIFFSLKIQFDIPLKLFSLYNRSPYIIGNPQFYYQDKYLLIFKYGLLIKVKR